MIVASLIGLALGGLLFHKQLLTKLFPFHQERPNFLFIITDDQSWVHTSFAGYPAVQTPNFDRIAREGVYFENAFASAPTCTASRSAILTGRNFWELGPAGQLWGAFPETLQTYQQILERHGYKIGYSGKGWGPGYAPKGNPAGPDFNTVKRVVDPNLSAIDQVENLRLFLEQKEPGQPFSFWASPTEPHRPLIPGIGKASGTIPLYLVEVPPFLPNNEVIRDDIADYLYEIQWFDEELGRMLALLEEKGQLDNTVIVYTSDNGMPFPRAKSTNYDYGTRVPLAIRWGDAISTHREIRDFINLIDIAPTFLELAQVPVPKSMSGKSFVPQLFSEQSGWLDPQRDTVFTGFQRHIGNARIDNKGYPSRAIRTDSYLYIRNFAPERWPAGRPPALDDIDSGSPTKQFMIHQRQQFEKRALAEHKKEGGMSLNVTTQTGNPYTIAKNPAQSLLLAAGKRPAEELYVIRRDPGQIKNVADDPVYAEIKADLVKKLQQELERTGDPLVNENGGVFDSYTYYAGMSPDP